MSLPYQLPYSFDGTFTAVGDWSAQGDLTGSVLFLPQPPSAGAAMSAPISDGLMSAALPPIAGNYLVVFVDLALNGARGQINSFAFVSPSAGWTVNFNTNTWPRPIFPIATPPFLGTFAVTGDWSADGDVSGSAVFIPQPASAGLVEIAAISNGVVSTTLPVIDGIYLTLFQDIELGGVAEAINSFAFASPSANATVNLNTASSPPAVLQVDTPPSLGTFTVTGDWSRQGNLAATVMFLPQPESAGSPAVVAISNGVLFATLPVIDGNYEVIFLAPTLRGTGGTINGFAFASPSANTSVNLNTVAWPAPVFTGPTWRPRS